MDIQATKLELIQLVLNTQDEHKLLQAKAVLEDTSDFWDELSQEDKDAIDDGIAQIERGESMTLEESKAEIKKRFNF